MVRADGFSEAALVNADGLLKGWKASEDIREISASQFRALTGIEPSAPFVDDVAQADDLPMPRFHKDPRQIRDPKFRERVYRAYRGRCAVTGLTLLWANGYCGLIAAHVYPHAMRAYNSVSAGILLAPNWHSRYDNGELIIDKYYNWSVPNEDDETRKFSGRRLMVPASEEERPDLELLRLQRALFT